MRRTKQWWAGLTEDERSYLVYLERSDNQGGSFGGGGYLPDDCSDCSACGNPMFGGYGICPTCSRDLEKLIDRADSAVIQDGSDM